MTSTESLKRGMLAACNQIRVMRQREPLSELPAGFTSNGSDCSGHRALRDLGFGNFSVGAKELYVDSEFAGIIARTWGTEFTACDKPITTAVTLPPEMTAFITAFDQYLIPELAIPVPDSAKQLVLT